MPRISLKDITVEFPIYGGNLSFRKAFIGQAVGGLIKKKQGQRIPVVTALDSISLEINDGDRVALIGHNGAGKSTLLRTLAGIYSPVAGEIQVLGRISPLFDMSLGMRPELTGLENIYSIGMFLGMTKKEVTSRIDEVINFASLGEFSTLPVKTYSTGMQWRLAFSIATSIETDILLLDEGIGAVDSSFTVKAERRINDLVSRSSAVVIASHSESLIRSLCNKAVLLQHGKLTGYGALDEMLELYNSRSDRAPLPA
jgi:ABC-2 type transport system ATP-binding protein